MTPSELKEEQQKSAWLASLSLRDAMVGGDRGFDMSALARAAYYAGRSYALHQARDTVETLQEKLKAKG